MNKASVDNDFIQRVVENYSDMVMRIAFQNTRNQVDSEDIAQEVFMKLMKQPAFQDDEHLKAWLIRVTINQCKDLKKSFWNRNRVPFVDDEWLSSKEDQEVFIDLWELPKKYRDVLYLYYYEGYTAPQIAQILNKKENTVSSWLTRAKKQLKKILIEGEKDDK